MKATAFFLSSALVFSAGLTLKAEIKLPAIFSDHMVLQRDVEIPVWGWADAGESVTVSLSKEGAASKEPIQTHSATADAKGKWSLKLSKLKEAGTLEMLVMGKNSIAIQDVLVGEVWLGSGQSNMAMTVSRASQFEEESKNAMFPRIRMFKEESASSATEQKEGRGKWQICSPESVGTFSATLYFFGREIHKSLEVPVGLINSSVGGTPIEAWISPAAQNASEELKPFFEMTKANSSVSEVIQKKYERNLAKWKEEAAKAKENKQRPGRPPVNPSDKLDRKNDVGGLFNGKIAPLIPFAIRGAVWYQGEANSTPEKAPFYGTQLKLLISDWRARWQSEFPFAWAQLPNFGGPGREWPLVREGMLKTLALPNTGMGINIDIGEEKNIHPTNKQEVGRRLSLWALGAVYQSKVDSISGPLPAGNEIRGKELVLKFSHADGGLVAKNGDLTGFVVAGPDKQWKPAKARIEKDQVILTSSEVSEPVAARYAWENFPSCNLYNGAGLPASPFRTDDW